MTGGGDEDVDEEGDGVCGEGLLGHGDMGIY